MNEQLIMKRIAKKIKTLGLELGFNHIGISDLELRTCKKTLSELDRFKLSGRYELFKEA